MAATYHQGGLQALTNPSHHIYSPFKLHLQGNRKSAVELLQETKSLYVKSNTVLGANQAFKAKEQSNQFVKKCEDVEGSRGKLIAVRRSNISAYSDQLQAKLRRLLNVDSKENLQDVDACSDSVKRERVISQGCKSLPDLTVAKELSPTRGKPGRRKSSGDGVPARLLSSSSTIKGTTFSNLDYEEESEYESSEESCSSTKSYGKPPSLGSVSLGGSTSKVEIRKEGGEKCVEWEGEPVGVIPRSKSDLAWREKATSNAETFTLENRDKAQQTELPVELPSSLEDFFNYLGLPHPKYLEEIEKSDICGAYLSGSSSVESGSPRRRVNRPYDVTSASGSSDSGTKLRTQTVSIVETNARVIKWLCNCHKTNS